MARILIVDDDGLTRMLLRRILERAGYEADEACNGIEGVKKFRERKYALAIVDIFMPRQDGLETIDQMGAIDAGVPVIAISAADGVSGTHPLRLAECLGASATFHKDFKDDELLRAVRRLTRGGHVPA